jgi:O-antigen/teichoic acid export membrane protein
MRPEHRLRAGTSVRKRPTIANGIFGVAEYASQPLGLLLSSPYLLRHMGAAQFGVWVLASAAVNGGNALSTGFGDAAIKYVAMYRGKGDASGVGRVVRGMMSINLALSGLFAIGLWNLAPYATYHIARTDAAMQLACLESFRIGSMLLIVRSIDSVFASTLRAFEQYGPPVRISISSRLAVLMAAIALVAHGRGVAQVMLATLVISALAAIAQGWAVRRAAGKISLLPSFDSKTLKMIAGFGCFSWLQALSAVIFGQADRLVIGVLLGTPAVAIYALCDQAAQSIHGVIAAGFHVLFPHLSARVERESLAEVRRTLRTAFQWNALLAVALGVPVIVLSRPILALWMGQDFAQQAWPVLSILATSFVLFAMNITAYYALLAVGRIRLVVTVNLAAGMAMLPLMAWLTPRFGIVGTACGWLITGPITCLLYLPLYRMFRDGPAESARPAIAAALENCP